MTVAEKTKVTEKDTKLNKSDAELLKNIDKGRAIALAIEAITKFEKLDNEKETRKTRSPNSRTRKTDKEEGEAAKPKTKADVGEKTFTIAGVSTVKGVMKIRFANATVQQRTKILERAEHEDIRLVEVNEGNRLDIAKQLLAMDEFKDDAAQEVILEFINNHE